MVQLKTHIRKTRNAAISFLMAFVLLIGVIPVPRAADLNEVSGAAVSISDIAETSAKLTIQNTSGETSDYPVGYYMVKQAGEAAPAAEELKAANQMTQDGSFTSGNTTSTTVALSNLNAGTDYVAYAVVYHAKTQAFSGVASVEFTTASVKPSGIEVSISDITETGAKLTIQNTSGETGTYPVGYYMVKQAGEAAPTAEELKAANQMTQDGSFTSGSTTSTTVALSNLTAGTDYVAYAVVYHAKTQAFSGVASEEFTTTSAKPSGIEVSISDITETGAKLTIQNTSKETGTYPVGYYMVKQAGEAAPTAEELKAANQMTQDGSFTSGSTTSTTVALSNLTAGTDYVAYAVVYHAKTQAFSGVASVEFTTASVKPSGIEVSISDITETGAKLTIQNTSGETGTYPVGYYMVKQAGEAAPTAEELKAANQMTQDGSFTSGSTTSTTVALSNLAAGTDYVAYAVVYHAKTQTFSGVANVKFTTTKNSSLPSENNVIALSYRNGDEPHTSNFSDYSEAVAAVNALGEKYTEVKLTLLKSSTVKPTTEYGNSYLQIQRDCVLDLSGFSMTVETATRVYLFELRNDARFEIMDSSEKQAGVVKLLTTDGCPIQIPYDAGEASFILSSGTISAKNVSNGADVYAISNSSGSVTINGGTVHGGVSLAGTMTVTGGLITAASPVGVVTMHRSGRLIMSGGEIRNTDTVTVLNSQVCAVNGDDFVAGAGVECIRMTGGTWSSINGPAFYFGGGVNCTSSQITIAGNAVLRSENDVAIRYTGHDALKTKGMVFDVKLTGNALLSGKAGIADLAKVKEETKRTEDPLRLSVDGNVTLEYAEGTIPFLPNSVLVNYPENTVLGVTPVQSRRDNGITWNQYKLQSTDELKQYIGTVEWGYQYFDNLTTAVNSAKSIYEAGNDAGTYDSELWSTFANAYQSALPIFENKNANQNEIDYFTNQLGIAQTTMLAAAETAIDLNALADGAYTVSVEMKNASFSGASMSNGAIMSEADLNVVNGEAYLTVHFKPIMQLGYWGSLIQFWVYDGDTPEAARRSMSGGSQGSMTEMVYPSYQIVNFTTGEVTPIEGTPTETPNPNNEIRPTAVTIKLPYIGNANDLNKIFCCLGVDIMRSIGVGDQPVILYIKYSTLQAKEIQATLSVDTAPVTLAPNSTQTVEAKVVGSSGWTLNWSSDNPEIAAVTAVIGGAQIKGIAAGTTSIRVSAVKDGENLDEKVIPVTVKAGTPISASVAVSGSMATAVVNGNILTTDQNSVDVGSSTITINAGSGNGAKETNVVFSAETLAALKETGYTIAVETGTGTIRMDKAMVEAAAAVGKEVTLSIQKVSIPRITDDDVSRSDFVSAYELAMTSGSSTVGFKNGKATIVIPWGARYGYAYYISGGSLKDVQTMVVSNGTASWTTDHFSTWALSEKGTLMDKVGIKTGTYSVPIRIKQANQPGADSMANDATGGMVVAKVTNSGVTYTMFLKARVGTELGSEPLRGHLIKMWYYDPNDTGRDNPIAATVVRTYQDKDMNGKTGTFPREVQIYQEGKPRSQYYIQVYVDAMGTNYQDAIVRLDWDNALSDNGKAARSAFTDKLATEQTINSGNTVSRTQLKKWINEDNTLLLQGKDDDLTASFSTAALESIYDESNSNVKFVLEERKASKLTGTQAKKAGERPVYALELTHGGKAIPSIGSGSVSVTLPYALGKDETAEGLAILIVSDDGTGRNIKCTYNARSRTVNFSTKNFGVFVIAYDADHIWNNPFTDVKETDWFYDAVRYVNQKGLFSGTTATTFSPNLATTRAMLVTVLYRLDGQPAVTGSSKFSDMSAGQYYTNAVIWATENGIVSGYGNGMFDPDALLSREQMATILYNYAKYKQYDVSKVRGLDVFTDKDTVAPYAVRAMQWAYANEIINGSSATTLSPKGTATRAQVAAILMRFDEKVKMPAGAASK